MEKHLCVGGRDHLRLGDGQSNQLSCRALPVDICRISFGGVFVCV